MILAPLRGVTIRSFRASFARPLAEAGFAEAFTPFITAQPGFDPLKDRELRPPCHETLALTPQFIGKDPAALRACLLRIREAGYETADLNAGCPYPMVRNKGRGSGLLRTPDLLRQMLEVGCETMGPGKFSLKTRLGIDRPDELAALMPLVNAFPLRFLIVHARTARQMYGGACDWERYREIEALATLPVIPNGDLDWREGRGLVGRSFVRSLGEREDIEELLTDYLERSRAELHGEQAVLGRLKELVAYWKDIPAWKRRWSVLKLARSTEEFRLAAQ